MSPALMLILGAAAGSSPAAATAPPAQSEITCSSINPNSIMVCAQRGQPYRLDPSITDAHNEVETNSRSAITATPAAQANCLQSPSGCGKGLQSLDLANVALVLGTTVVKAAKGEDWQRAFRPGGPDEYQLYKEAKRTREAQQEAQAAAEMKRRAEQAERQASATTH